MYELKYKEVDEAARKNPFNALLDTPEGYDPLSIGASPMEEKEKALYLYMLNNNADNLDKGAMLPMSIKLAGYDIKYIESLCKRGLCYKQGGKINMLKPEEAKAFHPIAIEARKKLNLESRLAVQNTLEILNDIAKEVGVDTFKARMLSLMRGANV